MKKIRNHKKFTHSSSMLNSFFSFAFILIIITSMNENFTNLSKDDNKNISLFMKDGSKCDEKKGKTIIEGKKTSVSFR